MHSSNPIYIESFLKTWNEGFHKVKNILKYLKTYPDVLTKTELTNIQDPDGIDLEQKDWIWLCSKFDHPLEKEFFKPYWIPIVKDSLDYFIDITDDSYPIFETMYFFLEPYKWYKKFIVKDIRELLLAHDEKLNFNELDEHIEQQHWESIEELFEKRIKLGFDNVLHVKKVKLKEIPSNVGSKISYEFSEKESTLTIMGVSPLVIGLLPHEQEIQLKSLTFDTYDVNIEIRRVKNIRDMVHLLRTKVTDHISNYSVDLIGGTGKVSYQNNKIAVLSSDFRMLSKIIKDLEKL